MPKTSDRTAKAAKPPKPPKPWERTTAGSYRSADGRFEVEQAEGRWFVRDESALDELGLPRTVGPLPTLEAAKDAAERAREAPAPVSPLAARLEESRKRPSPAARRAPRPAASAAPRGRDLPGSSAAAPAPEPRPAPAPPPAPPSWLDDLSAEDATRVRRTIAELERLGFADAERIVRADETTDGAAVASALLARLIVGEAVSPWRNGPPADPKRLPAAVRDALRRAHAAGVADEDVNTIVAWVAETAVASALRPLSELERDPAAPPDLPGWQLLERRRDARASRRVRLAEGDLQQAHAPKSNEPGPE